jgi:predicted ATPase/DNA-binding SARP family transcriptional activator
MPATEFRILGPVEAVHAGKPVPLGGPRQRALLAALLVEGGRVVSADRLGEIVWEGRPPPGAAGTLRTYVSRLRSALDDGERVIEGRPPGYAIHAEWVDAERFEQLVAEGRAAAQARDPGRASELLGEALGLWRGPALAEVPAMHAEAARLEGLRDAALEDRIEADLALGRHEEVVPELESLLAADPLRERLWGALMLALYRGGRQADALAAFQRARTVLDEELGLEPTPELRALEQQILTHEVPAPAAAERGNLPAPVSSFVGRTAELAELAELLRSARLVTLTGIGGAGKTRLALEAAGRARPGFPDGAWLVELAGTTDGDLVPTAAAAAIGVADRPDRPLEERLADRVRTARALIVLDNCEQVLPAAARLAGQLLRAGPEVTVLATSREPLGVGGETAFLLPQLGSADAEALFADRAPAHRRALLVRPESRAAVTRLCAELDALPLAIELAAARLAVLSPEDIAARLDDRLRFLRAGPAEADARHQTLEAMIDWSHELLEPDARTLLARLSAFPGGCFLAGAQAVWDEDVLDPLDRLIRASLVTVGDDPAGTRYRMLETVRHYAGERLAESGEGEAVARRHAEHFAGRADAAWIAWDSAAQVECDRALWADVDNLRAALGWALAQDGAVAGRLARGFGHIGRIHGLLDEVHRHLAAALAGLPDGEEALRADLTGIAGLVAVRRSAFGDAIELLEQAVELAEAADARHSLARHLYGLGYALGTVGNRDESAATHRRAVEVFREVGDAAGAAWSLGALADLAVAAGQLDEAARLHAEERPLAEASGSQHLMLAHLASVAELELQRGNHDASEHLAAESLALAEAHDDPVYVGLMHHLLAHHARRRGDLDLARDHLRSGLSSLRKLESGLVASAIETLAGVESDAGQPGRAARLLGAAGALRERSGAPPDPNRAPVLEADVAAVRAALGEDAYAVALAAGGVLTLDQALGPSGP